MAFIVFMGTVYVLSKLFFEKVELDDHVPEGKIRTSKFKIIND